RTYGSAPPARSYGANKAPYARPDARKAAPYVRVEATFGAEASARPPRREARDEAPPRAPRDRSRELLAGNRVVLAFSVGKDDGVRPADLVGAITGEAGVTSRDLGAIRINDDFSTVEVSEALAEKVLKVMKGKTVRGEKVDVKAMS